jgi:hypothetical protein
MTIQELISTFDLTHTHTLVLGSDNLSFAHLGASSNNASVYIWVACKPDGQHQVLYVGKAGKGVHLRCTQHVAGFVNSGTGRRNAEELRRYLNDGYEIRVYARESGAMHIFGHEVSLYAAEEDALCSVLNPVLNRALFPSIGNSGKKHELLPSSEQADVRAGVEQIIDQRLIQSTAITTDDLLAQWDAYSEEQRLSIEKLLGYIETQLSIEHRAKLVGGYSGHPAGCNGVTTLTYAIPGSSGSMKKGAWQARVYFGTQPRVGFPLARLKSTAYDKVDVSEQAGTFSPKMTDEFIRNPGEYLI